MGCGCGLMFGVWGTLLVLMRDPVRHVGYDSIMSEADLFNAMQWNKRVAYRKAMGLPLE